MHRATSIVWATVACVCAVSCTPEVVDEPAPAGQARICFSTEAELDVPDTEHESQRFVVAESTEVDPAEAPESFLECSEGMAARARFTDEADRHVWVAVDVQVDPEGGLASEASDLVPSTALEIAAGSSAQIVIANDARGPSPVGLSLLTSGLPVLVIQADMDPAALDIGTVDVDVGGDTDVESMTSCATIAPATLLVTVDGADHAIANGENTVIPLGEGSIAVTNLHTFRREARDDVECTDVFVWTTSSFVVTSSD